MISSSLQPDTAIYDAHCHYAASASFRRLRLSFRFRRLADIRCDMLTQAIDTFAIDFRH
jgi:hypothetical protein